MPKILGATVQNLVIQVPGICASLTYTILVQVVCTKVV